MKKNFYLANLLAFCFILCSFSLQAQIIISTQPGNDTVCTGSSATFSVVATGGVGALSYSWQVSTDGGSNWNAVTSGSTYSGETTSSLLVNTSSSLSGYQYMCSVTDGTTTTPSSSALLLVDTVFTTAITGNVNGCVGSTTLFSNTTPGGTWSIGSTTTDTIDNAGNMFGIMEGSDNVTYTIINMCGTNFVTLPFTVNSVPVLAAISGTTTLCVGATVTLTNDSTGGQWSIKNTSIATVNPDGSVTGILHNTDSVFYTKSNTYCYTIVGVQITIDTLPSAITGTSTICAGTSATLSNTVSGGTWSSYNLGIATISSTSGIYTGVSSGSDSVFYALDNSCGINIVGALVVIDTLPSLITGNSSMCRDSVITLSNTISGGTWSGLHSTVDSIGASSGIVTAIGTGLDTISYTLNNSCGINTVTFPLSVITVPTVDAITGNSIVCANKTDTLNNLTTGGTWSNLHSEIDTVNSLGIVFALSRGVDTVIYTVSNMCGSVYASKTVSVDTLPGIIIGDSLVCVGGTLSLSNILAGGTWSRKHSAFDSINATTGVVHGISIGTDTIKYKTNNVCGLDSVTKKVYVIDVPVVTAILGNSIVCAGGTLNLNNSVPGGTWSNRFPQFDSINSATGIVHGIRRGIDTIYYTVTNYCGATTVNKKITIDSIPPIGVITGPSGVCVGSTIILNNSVLGGVWSHTDTFVANLHGTTFGLEKGLSSGIDTVKYSVHNTCATVTVVKAIHVDTLNAGIISGKDSICAGSSITLLDSAVGGVWISLHPSIATVDGNGVVTGVGGGKDSILYTVSNSCGTRSAYQVVIVTPLAVVGTISGKSNVCVGSSVNLVDTFAGGTWSSTNSSLVSITPYSADSIKVSGTSAGIDTILYTASNVCGANSATFVLSVDTLTHVAATSGPNHLCVGSTITLTNTTSGGTWRSGTPLLATVDGVGNVHGVAAGVASIIYKYSNACSSDSVRYSDTVYALPNAGAILGSATICRGTSTTLTDTVSGGTWSVSNGLGTISLGVFYGLNTGFDTVYYSVSDAHCTGKATLVERIDSLPTSYPIEGPNTVCVGNIISLTNHNVLGTHIWTTTNSNATISASGIVTGISSGLDTIMYNFSNACGTDYESVVIGVQTPLVGGRLTGPSYVCKGSMVTLIDTITGGTWLSSDPYIASIDGFGTMTGMITGRHIGSAIISYTFWNSCGSATDTQTLHVYGEAAPITGLDSVGVGLHRQLSNTTPGGVWVSTNTTIATVDSTGKVFGLLNGIDTIIYTVTNPCGTSVSKTPLYVGVVPSAGVVFGKDTVCIGLTINLGDTTVLGGVWSSVNGKVSVDQYGIVTGVSGPGFDTVYYSYTNGFGTGKVVKKIYVNSVPVIRIHHYNIISFGGSYPLIDTPGNGVWTSDDYSAITFVTGHMIVLQPSHNDSGKVTLVYSVSNLCGVSRDTVIYYIPYPIVVENKPNPISAFSVYPNPSTGNFTIRFSSEIEENANVSITNIVGQKVKEFTISSNKLSEFTIDQPDGVYFLNAATENSRFDIKIIVTR